MTAVTTVVVALAFFGLIMLSVACHEVGHMVPAKIFGVRVPTYSIGFGPKLWAIRRGDTEYGIRWLPLGGYVQLLGMYPPARPRTKPLSRWQQFLEQARAEEYRDITPADDGHLFYQKRTWQKIIIMVSGPAMNVLIAFGLFWSVLGLHGLYQPQTTVGAVQQCIIREDRTDRTCQATDEPTPAALAGLQPGDQVVSFNDKPITSHDQLIDLIRRNLDNQARIDVLRDGQRIALPAVRTVIIGVQDELDPSKRIAAGWLGVNMTSQLEKGGPVETIREMWTMTRQSVVALGQFPVKVYNVIADWITGQERDIYGPISIVGASVLAGQVATADAPLGDKVAATVWLLGSLNLFLALFNFVPLPPLDGGHVAGAVYEWIRRQVARLRKQPDPGPFDMATMLPLTYLIGAFLLMSGFALIVADIFIPISLF